MWLKKGSRSKPGKFYFFNTKTGESTWSRPDGIDIIEERSSNNEPKKAAKRKVDSDSSPNNKRRKDNVTQLHAQSVKESSEVECVPSGELLVSSTNNKYTQKNRKKREKIRAKKKSFTSNKEPLRVENRKESCASLTNNNYSRSENEVISCTNKSEHLDENESSISAFSKCLSNKAVKNYIFSMVSGHSTVTESPSVQDIAHTKLPAQSRLNRLQCKLQKESASPKARILLNSTAKVAPKSHFAFRGVYSECGTTQEFVQRKINEVLPYANDINVENRNFEDSVKETTQVRLKRCQDSLKSKVPLKELSQLGSKDTIPSRSSNKLMKCTLKQDTAASLNSAESRLRKLQSRLIIDQQSDYEDSKRKNEYQVTNNEYDCEAMEVEYMESEILSDIGELRQKGTGTELHHQISFMDVEISLDVPDSVDPKSSLFIVLDTNILLSHLKFAKGLRDSTIPGRGPVQLYLPWQVLHELDHLKDHGKSNVQSCARQAIHYLHENFSSKHPRVQGQTLNEANTYTASNPDDNILQACLQLKDKGHDVVLLSNDINLLNKALVCDVQAVSKDQFVKHFNGDVVKQIHRDIETKPANDETKLSGEKITISEASLNDTILCDLKGIMKQTLTDIVSKGMQDEYPLWEKRTIIPPPWEADQVLKCLGHHWLPLCGDFIPPSIKQNIEKLMDFLKEKTKRYGVKTSDLKESLNLMITLLEALPEKYSWKVDSAVQKLKALEKKLEGNACCSQNNPLVLLCFEAAHNAVSGLCTQESLSKPGWLEKAETMLVAVHSLIELLKLVLSKPVDSLNDEDSEFIELTNLIKGEQQITSKDLITFCREGSNRTLLENGIHQFIGFENHLSTNMSRLRI